MRIEQCLLQFNLPFVDRVLFIAGIFALLGPLLEPLWYQIVCKIGPVRKRTLVSFERWPLRGGHQRCLRDFHALQAIFGLHNFMLELASTLCLFLSRCYVHQRCY